MPNPDRLVKAAGERLLGPRRARAIAYAVKDEISRLQYRSLPDGRRSGERLRQLRDAYSGRRAFIIGNGPSLQYMDLSPLKAEITFGLNRIGLAFERLGFATTFIVAVNRLVLEQSANEILSASVTERFVAWRARHVVSRRHDAILLRSIVRPHFSRDASEGVWEGATVTFVAMQLAYHLGIRDLVLVGVDHSFATSGIPHEIVTSRGPDRDHFDRDYFGPGYRWQLPDLKTSEVAYSMARIAFEYAGGRIRDATVAGKLRVFEKARFDDLFTSAEVDVE